MTMIEKFEGREIPATYPTAREIELAARRAAYRATRAPYQRVYQKGTVGIAANSSATVLLASSTTRDLERIKRVQLKLMVPKGSVYGWMGFVRDPEAVSVISQPPFDAPIVLRPTRWMGNPDYASYWDAYLPAVNLADGGRLLGVFANDGGSTVTGATYVARFVLERGIEG